MKEMKKKVLALVCAMSLACGGVLTAQAASVGSDDVVADITENVSPEVAEVLDSVGLPAGSTVKVEDGVAKINTASGEEVAISGDGSVTLTQGNGDSISIPVAENKATEAVAQVAQKALVKVAGSVEATVKAVDTASDTVKKELKSIATTVAYAVTNGGLKPAGAGNADTKTSVETAFVVDIKAPDAGKIAFKASSIGVKIDPVAVGLGDQRVYALHCLDNGEVETILCDVVDGNIVFDLSSYSTVAIVVATVETVGEDVSDDAAPAEGDATPAAPAAGKSPKTAEAGTTAAVVVIAMMSIAGLVVLKRRVNDTI